MHDRLTYSIVLVLVTAISTAALGWGLLKAGHESAAGEGGRSRVILGRAFLDQPVAQATVRVVDRQGNVVFEQARATDAVGLFTLALPDELEDVRVEVSGGVREGIASDALLKADIHLATALRAYVNAGTTLAALRLDADPQMGVATAHAATAAFLKLPPGVSLGIGLSTPQAHAFSHASFMRVAAAHGGVNALIAELAGQMARQQPSSYDFAPGPAPRKAGDVVFSHAVR